MTEEQAALYLQRIDKLTVDHKGTFGVMTVNQMVCQGFLNSPPQASKKNLQH